MMRKLLYSFLFFISSKIFPKGFSAPSLGLLCVGMFFVVSSVNAVTKTATTSGNWSSNATWGGATPPAAGDDVVINSGVTVTVNVNTQNINSLVINSASSDNGITINSGSTLNVSGLITINAPSGNVSASIAVGSGTLNAGNINIGGGTGSRVGQVTVTTGTINVTGNISFSGTAAQARLSFTGSGILNIAGNLNSGGAFSASSGTVNFNGSGNQNIGGYTYNNLTTSGNGTKSALGNLTVGGSLNVGSNTILNMGTNQLLGTLTTIANNGVIRTQSTNGTPIPTGKTWGGTMQYDGTSQTISQGIYSNLTISGTNIKTLNANTTVNNNLSIESGTTLDVSTTNYALNVGGNFTNNGTFTPRTGVVTLNGSGAQSFNVPNFYNLTLAGSGTKYFTGTTTVAGALVINSGVKADLGTVTHSTNTLTLNGNQVLPTSWGSTSSIAQNKTDTYFANSGIINVSSSSCTTFSSVTAITNVLFGSINNPTSASSTAPYIYYSNVAAASVSKGQYYELTVKGYTNGSVNNYYTAFFDWNGDGDFADAGEGPYKIGTINSSTGTDGKATSIYLQIPTTATSGLTKMRVMSRRTTDYNPDACAVSGTSGQIQDYNITILDACVGNAPGNTLSTASSVCPSTPFTLSLQNTMADGTSYVWQTSLDGNAPWTSATATPTTFFSSTFSANQAANTNVGDISLYGNDTSITGGVLYLTTLNTSYSGGFVIQKTPGININTFSASFDYKIYGGNGADGLSLSYASNIANNVGGGESGEGSGIVLQLDTYDNEGVQTGSRVRITYNGSSIFNSAIDAPFNLRTSSTTSNNVVMSVNDKGYLTLTIAGTVVVSNLALPAAYLSADKSNWKFKFSGRTGASNDNHVIDNVNIYYLDTSNSKSTFTTTQTVKTYYRVAATCGGTTVYSTPVIVDVISATINPMTTNACTGVAFTVTPANGTDGTIPNSTNYTWTAPSVTGGLTGGVANNVASSTITGTLVNPTTTAQTATYTVTPITGSCTGVPFTLTVTVNPNNTATLTSASGTNTQAVCSNTPITNITYSTTGATGATVTGLPAGVTGSWSGNVVTISGTPTASSGSPFNYTVTLTGGCGTVTTTGTITVNPNNTVSLTSGAGTNSQTVCINSAITNITYSTTGATGATVTGLPAGVTGGWSGNVVTISGTPTASAGSPFNYTVTLTGGCGTVSATGTITVNPNNTVSLTSGAGTNSQTVCINSAITNITYSTTGATGATVTGLPAGVTESWSGNVVTISGTPTASSGSPFNYTVTLTGGCGTVTTTGTITVNPNNTVSLTSAAGTNAQTRCINNAITNITYSTTGATGATVTGLPAGVTGGWSGNVVTISGTPTASSGSPFNYTVALTGGCGTVTTTGTITVNPNNTVSLTSGAGTNSQTVCINSAITNITYSTTGATGATVTGLPAGVTGGWSGNVVTISGTPTASAGSPFNYTVTLTGGCGTVSATGTITVNPSPLIPSITKNSDVSCGSFGSITITGLSGNWTINQTGIMGSRPFNGTSSTFPIQDLIAGTHYFTVTDNTTGCTSGIANITIDDITLDTEWDGSGWTNGAPDGNKRVTISSVTPSQPFPLTVPATNVIACSLIITSTSDVIIPSQVTLTITNKVTSNSRLVFESGSSLVQTTNVQNTGDIVYKRAVNISRYDVVYWSMPVTKVGFTMHDLSPKTLYDKYFYWDAFNGKWVYNINGTEPMKKGEGYNIRAPQDHSVTSPSLFTGVFTGVPNNGDVNVTVVPNKWNFLGNPYPSAIDADELILDTNKDVLGSLYFWTHSQAPQIISGTNTYRYISSDYLVYNGVGSIRVNNPSSPTDEFKGYIAAGQGFFAMPTVSQIKFNNDLRRGSSENTQFYKTARTSKIEKNRLWLNVANSQGAFKQMLIGYIEGATNANDVSYDAITMGSNSYVDFYSINDTKRLTIQGRALPFDNTEVIPLGFKCGIDATGDRTFTISIDHADGFFNTQEVYLEDKALGKVTDLRKENYTFTSGTGTYSNRFALRYTNKTLGTGDFENIENTVLVSVKDKAINITSSKETVKEVDVYNIGAELLYSNSKVNASQLQIKNLHSSDQVLLVTITLENGHTFTKKVIFF
ncbi:GEVED domain-containing protein [Flavobacterium sp.]|uniref:GEVED domain-containing protein n=1 Tax=Flavobacterium sp. TaxID=239 RepID=UPI0031CF00C7